VKDPQDVVSLGGSEVLVTAGASLLKVDVSDGRITELVTFDGKATGLDRRDSDVYVCVSGAGLFAYDLTSGRTRSMATTSSTGPLANLSAVALVGDRILISSASSEHLWQEWPHDLMGKGKSGAVLEVTDSGRVREVRGGLAWPFGLCDAGDGMLLYTESWAHRVSRLDPATGNTTAVLERLFGYPARIRATGRGTFLLAFFALRTHLLDFLMREDRYRARMVKEIPVDDWIRPAYRTKLSVRQPLQFGAAVHLGEIKPWAPARSYGLVSHIDACGNAISSYHSRAGGVRHGVTAACRVGDEIVVACRGNDELVAGLLQEDA
jgi:hypothetical protein